MTTTTSSITRNRGLVHNIEKLLDEWERDSEISEYELDRASIDSSKLHAKYLELFMIARLNLRRAEAEYSALRKLKWLYYTGKMTKKEMDDRGWDYDPFSGTSKPMKSDLQMYIEEDNEMKDLSMRIEYLKTIYDCLNEIIQNIRWRHTNIANAINFKKFQAGM
jgi:hypothetical protein